ncbi:mobilome CxxCx(11)CxxC protein [Lysobacter sp. Root494]|uniref:mobilome CxxCx(11)CxxC protein n=1 Tax=Lysobacter sp. Root494 TaxID=1736549 RepID=UPI0009E7E8EA|nr:mobilome CxxCx(11)CxxC protein [Lysobacter sp. Root494]
MTTTAHDVQLKDCWDRAIFAYGTAELFALRARSYRRLLNAISGLGIAVPLLLGGAVMTYGTTTPYLTQAALVAGTIGLAQLLLSGMSVVYGWPASLEYALDSSIDNRAISERFKQLGSLANSVPADFDARYRELVATDNARRNQDGKAGVDDKELRRGHRAALRQFQKECSGCGIVPLSMQSTDCDICGRFKWTR